MDIANLPTADSVSKWYSLAKEVLADIRGNNFKSKVAKQKRYSELFNAVRRVHVDYVTIFTCLRDSCNFKTESVEEAKRNFLSARGEFSPERQLTKADASAYLYNIDELGERRFIAATLWYFQYEDSKGYDLDSKFKLDLKINSALSQEDGADANWDSVSTLVWRMIEDSNDGTEIARFANLAIASITARFNAVIVSYTELEGAWNFSKPIQPSVIKVKSGW